MIEDTEAPLNLWHQDVHFIEIGDGVGEGVTAEQIQIVIQRPSEEFVVKHYGIDGEEGDTEHGMVAEQPMKEPPRNRFVAVFGIIDH